MNDYSVFDNKYLTALYPLDKVLLSENGIVYAYIDDEIKGYNFLSQRYIFRRNTQIKDKLDNDIYEYDLIEFKNKKTNFSYTGIVVLKRGRFVVKDISYLGEILYDENYEILLPDIINNYTELTIIDNSLKMMMCQKNIRNKFYFKVINKYNGEVLKDCYIDDKCNVYNILDINDSNTYHLISDAKIVLSTDTYDKQGNIIYYKDSINFEYNGLSYTGSIEYDKGYYYIDNIRDIYLNSKDFKIQLYDKFTDNRLKNINVINTDGLN